MKLPNTDKGRLLAGILEVEDVDREIENIKDRIAVLKAQIKEQKGKRKLVLDEIRADTGFPPAVVEQLLKDRHTSEEERRGYETLLQIARATLGMLDGTPLGDAARRAYERRREDEDGQGGGGSAPASPKPSMEAEPDQPPPQIDTIDDARGKGQEAARAGKLVTENPYPADQMPQRAAWDEGWCSENGSDGMEIPEAFRRKEKKDSGEPTDGDAP